MATENYVTLTRRINDLLNYYTSDFKWTTIRIFVGNYVDYRPSISCTGPSAAILLGSFKGGSFRHNEGALALTKLGMFAFFDPAARHSVEEAKGRRYLVILEQLSCHGRSLFQHFRSYGL